MTPSATPVGCKSRSWHFGKSRKLLEQQLQNLGLPQRITRQSLHFDRKWRHRLPTVGSKSHKRIHFWVMFGSRFLDNDSIDLKEVHSFGKSDSSDVFHLVSPAKHFGSLSPNSLRIFGIFIIWNAKVISLHAIVDILLRRRLRRRHKIMF